MTAKSVDINYDNINNEMDNKAAKTLENLTTALAGNISQLTDAFLDSTYTIIYPFGTEENPGILSLKKTYIIPNPFPGYAVTALVEVYAEEVGEWGVNKFHGFYTSAWYGAGAYIYQHDNGDLVLKTGQNYLLVTTPAANEYYAYPSSFLNYTPTQNANFPFRLKVKKIGKLSS